MGHHATTPYHSETWLPPLVYSRTAIQHVDRDAIERYGIPGIVLMENAALGLTGNALKMLGGRKGPVLVCCGSGNNGGDGYALARHLHNRGVSVTLAPLREPREGTDAWTNWSICRRLGLPVVSLEQAEGVDAELVVDAVFGTGLDRPVAGDALDWIAWINRQRRPVLSVDVPSGLDCESGSVLGEAITATRTVTFVGWKQGFETTDARARLGEVVVVDIGAPIELYLEYGTPRGA
ncbi:MAG: NAD(P)H-hydrate epimerase [Planctomycetota bacterium]|jgi:NAD(P)H-hydrate epimerase